MDKGLPSPSSSSSTSSTTTTTTKGMGEVWCLVDKYHVDLTFNVQNWDAARVKYVPQNNNNNNNMVEDATSMRAANEMIKSLGDKYTHLLDQNSYVAIQQLNIIGVGAMLIPDSHMKRLIVGAPPVRGYDADLGGMKEGDYIMAVNGVNTEVRTAFNIIDQISDDPNSSLFTMTKRTAASSTNGDAPSSSANDVVRDISTMR